MSTVPHPLVFSSACWYFGLDLMAYAVGPTKTPELTAVENAGYPVAQLESPSAFFNIPRQDPNCLSAEIQVDIVT